MSLGPLSASARVVARTVADGFGDRLHRLRCRGESIRSIRNELRRSRCEVPGRVVELRRRRRRSEAVGRLLPSATSALRKDLFGIAGQVLPLLDECCVTFTQASLPVICRECGLVAGVLARALIPVVGHCSSSDLGNEGLYNLRDILAQRLWLL